MVHPNTSRALLVGLAILACLGGLLVAWLAARGGSSREGSESASTRGSQDTRDLARSASRGRVDDTPSAEPAAESNPGGDPSDHASPGGSSGTANADRNAEDEARAAEDAGADGGPPYPEHIELSAEELRRRRDFRANGGRVRIEGGPRYDDEGDLNMILHLSGGRMLRQYTWGEPADGDLSEPPYLDRLVEKFGVWMPGEDDGRYTVGFRSAAGDFFELAGHRLQGRALGDVPPGRDILPIGSSGVHEIRHGSINYLRLRGGYAIPGLPVVDRPETDVVESIWITFEGYPRIAIDRVADLFGRAPGAFPKTWQVNPEVVVIPRLPSE